MKLTPEIDAKLDDIGARHAVSRTAVMALLEAVVQGQGRMAQFDIAELGGRGQWMAGGMTMVGDMFNHGLKAKVAAVCEDLAALMPGILRPQDGGRGAEPTGRRAAADSTESWAFSRAAPWWPEELGTPAQTGSQNATRYAIFPAARRIAIHDGTRTVVHDTLGYTIGGASQQGGHGGPLTLSTDRGAISIASLPIVSEEPDAVSEGPDTASPGLGVPSQSSAASFSAASAPAANARAAAHPERSESILHTIERLAELRDKGAITDAEFTAKKAELLAAL